MIDATTWERAGTAGQDFDEEPAVAIRGRRKPQDLYALRTSP